MNAHALNVNCVYYLSRMHIVRVFKNSALPTVSTADGERILLGQKKLLQGMRSVLSHSRHLYIVLQVIEGAAIKCTRGKKYKIKIAAAKEIWSTAKNNYLSNVTWNSLEDGKSVTSHNKL